MTLAQKIGNLAPLVLFVAMIAVGVSSMAYIGKQTPAMKKGIQSVVLGK